MVKKFGETVVNLPSLRVYEDEIILPVLGYENYYLVSSYGRVFSRNYRRTGKVSELAYSYLIDKRRKSKTHYVRSKMYHIDKNKGVKIHIIVASTFLIKNDNNLDQVNHINGIKSDNRACNLEWVNNKENQLHAFEKGLQVAKLGSDHSMAIIDESIAMEIKKMLKFTSAMDISRILGVSKHIVYDISRGKTWRHV
jgi:hypothetical protein